MQNLSTMAVAEKIGKAKSTLLGYVSDEFFPKPKKNGLSTYWDANVVDAWIILSENRQATLPPIAVADLHEIMNCVSNIQRKAEAVA